MPIEEDYTDNSTRACVLSKSAVLLEKATGWTPDVFHAHDWMAAPTAAYLNQLSFGKKVRKIGKSVLTIHNLEHQGVFSRRDFFLSGLPPEYSGIDGFEHQGSMNLLKGGIQHADKITTVSPTYASEVRTKAFGQGLEESLKYRGADLVGILNGIDQDSWNPQRDPALPSPIDPLDPSAGKKACKALAVGRNEVAPGSRAPCSAWFPVSTGKRASICSCASFLPLCLIPRPTSLYWGVATGKKSRLFGNWREHTLRESGFS